MPFVQVTLLALGSIVSFWPYFVGGGVTKNTYAEGTSLRGAVESEWFRITSFMSIALTLPMLTDAVIDGVTQVWEFVWKGGVTGSARKDADHLPLLTVLERILLMAGFVCPAAVAFLPLTNPELAMLWMCCGRFQGVAVFGTTWSTFTRFSPTSFPRWLFYIGMTSWVIGDILLAMPYVAARLPASSTPLMALATAAAVLRYVGFVTYYGNLLWWQLCRGCRGLRRLLTESRGAVTPSAETPAETSAKLTSYFPIAYVHTVTVGMLIIVISQSVTLGSQSPDFHTPASLLATNSAYLFLQFGILVFFLRKVRVVSALKRGYFTRPAFHSHVPLTPLLTVLYSTGEV